MYYPYDIKLYIIAHIKSDFEVMVKYKSGRNVYITI